MRVIEVRLDVLVVLAQRPKPSPDSLYYGFIARLRPSDFEHQEIDLMDAAGAADGLFHVHHFITSSPCFF
jgi:hypothetical protein